MRGGRGCTDNTEKQKGWLLRLACVVMVAEKTNTCKWASEHADRPASSSRQPRRVCPLWVKAFWIPSCLQKTDSYAFQIFHWLGEAHPVCFSLVETSRKKKWLYTWHPQTRKVWWLKRTLTGQVWWHMPLISVLMMQRQVDLCEVEASLVYVGSCKIARAM